MKKKMKLINAHDLSKAYMLKGKDKLSLATVINELEIQPTVDAVLVKHAKWIPVSDLTGTYECSNCRKMQNGSMPLYCDMCGAKMEKYMVGDIVRWFFNPSEYIIGTVVEVCGDDTYWVEHSNGQQRHYRCTELTLHEN